MSIELTFEVQRVQAENIGGKRIAWAVLGEFLTEEAKDWLRDVRAVPYRHIHVIKNEEELVLWHKLVGTVIRARIILEQP